MPLSIYNHRLQLSIACAFFLWSILVCSCHAKSWADIAANRHKAPTLLQPEEGVVTPETKTTADSAKISKKQTQNPCVYNCLPKGVFKARVKYVYDGDTLCLVDGRKVRFLGIDTPELKPIQPFALEAKEYATRHCDKREIYLEGDSTDRFGRLLSVVWTKLPDGRYLNVCEGLVAAGLATVYHVSGDPNGKSPSKKMVSLQNEARNTPLGLWKDFVDRNVVVTKYGAAYHLPTCRHLARSRNTRVLTASKALDQGLHPCRTCLED
ncbi:function [Seminavis robusta]|uniref:Function n=1 Tax=Seminavis robusta TaxID=568900 RepID=A0A9N8DBQ7_9STRA|nr:function [Seminavis robusta]|eukprot:Sro72_g039700.1 function (266) ;mRNA; f:18229-19026